ncbi:unnamed protein product, partial [Callosobruchus maculatus]
SLAGKVRRIKQAREEATAEIEQYRAERERQFKEYEAKHMGSREDIAAQIDRDTEKHMQEMEDNIKKNKDAVGLIFC